MRFYQNRHYVWCSPRFGSVSVTGSLDSNPPTSRPLSRYKQLQQESRAGDLHSALIKEQKAGLRKGAETKLLAGVITEGDRDEIIEVVAAAQQADFKPLIYVMPYAAVKSLIKKVPVLERAHPMSIEYIIEDLPHDQFDILDLSELTSGF